MADANYLRTVTVMTLIGSYSPILRDEMLSSSELLDRYEVEAEALITLGAEGLSFQRSELFAAITAAFAKEEGLTVTSSAGEEWTVTLVEASPSSNVALERGNQRLIVTQFALLTPGADARLAVFQGIADEHQLDVDTVDRWRQLLASRLPTDDELIGLHQELRNTPVGAAGVIRESLQSGGLSFDVLVPRSETYYRRLIGDPVGQETLGGFVTDALSPFVEQMLAGERRRALSLAWLLCSHSSISRVIDGSWKGDEQVLAKAFSWLAKHGDPVSRAGAIEVGLLRVQSSPGLAQPLVELISALLEGKPASKTDAFELLSALFAGIYGQMARCRVVASWPPFARRLAALAHAGLVTRQLIDVMEDGSEFIRWLRGSNESFFVLQCVVDMRTEPRWFPELATTDQWRNELFGRVWIAAASGTEAVESLGLKDQLLGDGQDSLPNRISRAHALLPGPLEGGGNAPSDLAEEMATDIETRLSEASLDTRSFGPLINASMWLRMPERLAEFAAAAVERANYQIPEGEGVDLSICLLGLASLAAVTRCAKLREALQMTLRITRKASPGKLTMDETFRIGILACAAHSELTDWSERVGLFMMEMAFQDLSVEEAKDLHSHLTIMCHLVPELWGTCGQAEAALAAVIGR